MAPVFHRLSSKGQHALYARIVERCKRPSPAESPSVVVFDFDGTLMDNRTRAPRCA